MKNPVSSKVSVGTIGGGAAGLVTALVLALIPAGHSDVRIWVTALIPVLLSAVGYFWTGYKAHHQATAAEVGAFVREAEGALALFHAAQAEAVPSPAGPSGLSGHVVAHDPPTQIISPAAPSTATIPEDHSTA